MKRTNTPMAAAAAIAVVMILQACQSLPENIDTLEGARTAVDALERDPLAQRVAPRQLANAQQALAQANDAYEEREPLETIEHDAYVALRNAQIAEQMIAEERAREELARGEAERTRVQLEARELEAERARQQAEQAAALAQQRATQLEQQAEAAEEARQQAQTLEQELADLKAEQTERGVVLTLDDVLFDTNRTALKPGASSTIDRIAQFLQEHAGTRLIIEGHTDSTGSDAYNRDLSERRADAVRDALFNRGVSDARLITRGLGETFPVASNDSAAGRQLNRRVEIVISDPNGEFSTAADRGVATG